MSLRALNFPLSVPRNVVTVIIGCVWILMMGHLVKTEIHIQKDRTDKTFVTSPIIRPFNQWMEIFYKGEKLGYSHTDLTQMDREGETMFSLSHRTQLKMKVLDVTQNIKMSGFSFFDAEARLKNFTFYVDTKSYKMVLKGEMHDQVLSVHLKTGQSEQSFDLNVPENIIFSEDMNFLMTQKKFRPGDHGQFIVFDPIAMGQYALTYDVLEKKDGLLKIEFNYRGLLSYVWLNEHREIVKEINPLGWVMIRSTREDALSDMPGNLDLTNATSIPVTKEIPNPQNIIKLTLVIQGIDAGVLRDFPPKEIQNIDVIQKPSGIEIIITKPGENDLEILREIEEHDEEAMSVYLKGEILIQTQHPLIVSTAHEIVDTDLDLWGAAKKINEWVFDTLEKKPVISIPSALDVLKSGYGDCNEHTVLFTALARAKGIPVIPIVGLVFLDNKFYYHAWPAVYVGEWVQMDPTFGQNIADTTHIPFFAGSLEEQARIASLVGRIQIEVIDIVNE